MRAAAARPPRRCAARGGAPSTRRVRSSVVINDPALSASQPVPALAASSLNALGHAAEAICVPHGNPVVGLVAAEAARLLASGFRRGEPDRDALPLGALLGGYALDASALGLHHVAAQTLVREGGVGHGPANAVLLPHTIEALRRRCAERLARTEAPMGGNATAVAADLARRAGSERIRDLGVPHDKLAEIAEAAARR